jgi:hypothetical protein
MKQIRVNDDFNTMLQNARERLEKILKRDISMEEFTAILSGQINGNRIMSLNFPFILLVPERILKGPGRKKSGSILDKYVNIVLEDTPR